MWVVGVSSGGSGCGSLVQLEMTCALQIFGVSLALFINSNSSKYPL